jgi:hypothetical protein
MIGRKFLWTLLKHKTELLVDIIRTVRPVHLLSNQLFMIFAYLTYLNVYFFADINSFLDNSNICP